MCDSESPTGDSRAASPAGGSTPGAPTGAEPGADAGPLRCGACGCACAAAPAALPGPPPQPAPDGGDTRVDATRVDATRVDEDFAALLAASGMALDHEPGVDTSGDDPVAPTLAFATATLGGADDQLVAVVDMVAAMDRDQLIDAFVASSALFVAALQIIAEQDHDHAEILRHLGLLVARRALLPGGDEPHES